MVPAPEEDLLKHAIRLETARVALTNMWVNSEFAGDIYCLGELTIGENAKISGRLVCKNCKINGHFHGTITAWEKVTIASSAKVSGSMTTTTMEVALGAEINCAVKSGQPVPLPEELLAIDQLYRRKDAPLERGLQSLLERPQSAPSRVAPAPNAPEKTPSLPTPAPVSSGSMAYAEETEASSGWW